MGRGVGYKYEYMMLFDDDMFVVQVVPFSVSAKFDPPVTLQRLKTVAQETGWELDTGGNNDTALIVAVLFTSESGNDADKLVKRLEDLNAFDIERGDEETETDPEEVKNFRDQIASFFDAYEVKPERRAEGSDAYIFAEDDHLEIGFDNGGEKPCLFVKPKMYQDGEDEIPYVINRRVNDAFNRLISEHEPDTFSYPTSAWTSEPLTGYGLPHLPEKKDIPDREKRLIIALFDLILMDLEMNDGENIIECLIPFGDEQTPTKGELVALREKLVGKPGSDLAAPFAVADAVAACQGFVYRMGFMGRNRYYKTLEKANATANKYFERNGRVLGIEKIG